MNTLTERLTVVQPVVVGGSDPTREELRDRIGTLEHVLIKFTQTRGGTELGFAVDRQASDLGKADFDNGTGNVHVEGDLTLNGDRVRCIADIDLATLTGTGQLRLVDRPWGTAA